MSPLLVSCPGWSFQISWHFFLYQYLLRGGWGYMCEIVACCWCGSHFIGASEPLLVLGERVGLVQNQTLIDMHISGDVHSLCNKVVLAWIRKFCIKTNKLLPQRLCLFPAVIYLHKAVCMWVCGFVGNAFLKTGNILAVPVYIMTI